MGTKLNVALVTALASVSSLAHALPINLHAAGFQKHGIGADGIIRTSDSVYNATGTDMDVISTIPRNPHSAGSQTVTISGWNLNTSVDTRCTICTRTATASVTCLGANALSVAGAWTRTVSFSTVQAPVDASFEVHCDLRATHKNEIRLIRVGS
jgi:hypothetical protein